MARWRIRVWLKDDPKVAVGKTAKHDCKLCMIAKAQGIAADVAKVRMISTEKVGWTVEKLIGPPGQWEIQYHDRQRIGDLPQRHGH